MWDTSETAETELTKVLIARGETEFKICQSRKRQSFGDLYSDFTDSPPLTEKIKIPVNIKRNIQRGSESTSFPHFIIRDDSRRAVTDRRGPAGDSEL